MRRGRGWSKAAVPEWAALGDAQGDPQSSAVRLQAARHAAGHRVHSDTGRRAYSRGLGLACAVIGLIVGGAGLRLVLRDQEDARQSLARLANRVDEDPIKAVFRRRDVGLAHHQLEVDGQELRRLLAARADQRQSVSLVAAGLVLSFAGTLVTLPW